jgi:hypothetical protein
MKKVIKRFILPSDKVNIKYLSGMNLDLKTKRKLQRQAKNWLKWIELHLKEAHFHDDENMYHKGEINFIKMFFFDKVTKKQREMCKKRFEEYLKKVKQK